MNSRSSIPDDVWSVEAEAARLGHVISNLIINASSGYSDDSVMANHRRHGFSAVIPKPYIAAAPSRVLWDVIVSVPSEAGRYEVREHRKPRYRKEERN